LILDKNFAAIIPWWHLPLHHQGIARALLELNARFCVTGVTALSQAAEKSHEWDVQLLLNHDADSKFPKNPAKSPLQRIKKCPSGRNRTFWLLKKATSQEVRGFLKNCEHDLLWVVYESVREFEEFFRIVSRPRSGI
jgi:hypothetical protein